MSQYCEICKQVTNCTDDCCQCLKEELNSKYKPKNDEEQSIIEAALLVIDEHLDMYNISQQQRKNIAQYVGKHWVTDRWDENDDFYNYVGNILDEVMLGREKLDIDTEEKQCYNMETNQND